VPAAWRRGASIPAFHGGAQGDQKVASGIREVEIYPVPFAKWRRMGSGDQRAPIQEGHDALRPRRRSAGSRDGLCRRRPVERLIVSVFLRRGFAPHPPPRLFELWRGSPKPWRRRRLGRLRPSTPAQGVRSPVEGRGPFAPRRSLSTPPCTNRMAGTPVAGAPWRAQNRLTRLRRKTVGVNYLILTRLT
jgi:hypothetical protein